MSFFGYGVPLDFENIQRFQDQKSVFGLACEQALLRGGGGGRGNNKKRTCSFYLIFFVHLYLQCTLELCMTFTVQIIFTVLQDLLLFCTIAEKHNLQ